MTLETSLPEAGLPAGARATDGEAAHAAPPAGRIALIAAPFNSVRRPSIQVGLLSEIAREAGWHATTHHLFLDFAAMASPDFYEAVANDRGVAVGDWLFSLAAFGDRAPDPTGEKLIAAFDRRDRDLLLHVRTEVVPAFVELAAAEIARAAPDVAGFTSTFQQTAAAIAIGRRLKQMLPDVVTVYGGANFEREMAREWLSAVPEIDLILSGEADRTFPVLLGAIADGAGFDKVRGLAWRGSDGAPVQNPPAPLVTDLDRNPVPDYQEYFARAEYFGILPPGLRNDIRVPFESARGCWWGENQHCTFCGLNALSMKFRSKPAEKVLEELGELARRHRSYHFEAVDNIIDRSYMETLLPRLSRPDVNYDLFYEVKSNLKPADMAALAAAGIRTIQPGIESLSTDVLKLMRKGVRGLDNLNMLRWAAHHGIAVSWNVLWGFPGESREDYDAQAALFAKLHHLQPPSAGIRIWLERFSPLYKDEKAFPRKFRRPERSLDFILPPEMDKEQVAYFFEYELENTLPKGAYAKIEAAIEAWKQAWMQDWSPRLTYFSAPDVVTVEDARTSAEPAVVRYRGREARVFQSIIEKPLTAARIAEKLGEPQNRVDRALRLLAADGVVAAEGGLFLALPLPFKPR
ncbi:RiPP maturation radical SAM C-methyltransferase [Futiania mangrovi]|uniref:RiPP maturation radical SAM C-methyltransferase n=1 Tax=Futiania mangrovi TaxID=2959716 RepID=A0A9J6PM54_9PROT|nr:RiPP maturation radical SAM C-methyltransferase [Futiania mangrovii]MCP1337743.1 RiPP maturation radical SAM C-methyltransferase [Futiania mangrovii]